MSQVINKLLQNKAVTAAGLVACAIVGFGLKSLYDDFKAPEGSFAETDSANRPKPHNPTTVTHNHPHHPVETPLTGRPLRPAELEAAILQLRSEINPEDPSTQDLKKVLVFSMAIVKSQTSQLSKRFRDQRRTYGKNIRRNKFGEYLKLLMSSMQQLQMLSSQLNRQIRQKLGINEMALFNDPEIASFMEELTMQEAMMGGELSREYTLDEVKKSLRCRIEYLSEEGAEVINMIAKETSGWPLGARASIPLVLEAIISDEVSDQSPIKDEDELKCAIMMCQSHVKDELSELEVVMMGFMEAFNASQEGLLEQLERMQMTNPEAFARMGGMMGR